MSKKVEVGKKILIANEEYAIKNSRFFAEQKKLCLNMISSPGSGKTTILARTIRELGVKLKIGVIEGDIQTKEPKIEVWRKTLDKQPLAITDTSIIAVVTHDNIPNLAAPVWPRADVTALAEKILAIIASE